MSDTNSGSPHDPWAGSSSSAYSDGESSAAGAFSATASTNTSAAVDAGPSGSGPSQVKTGASDSVVPANDGSIAIPLVAVHRGLIHPPAIAPSTPFIKNPPHSKTAVGRLTFELRNLPKLFVAQVQTTIKPDSADQESSDVREVVKNKKLRLKAIKEILEMSTVASSSANTAINQDSTRNLDHLITPIHKDDTASDNTNAYAIDLEQTRKIPKKSKDKMQTNVDDRMQCTIRNRDVQLDEQAQADLYWKSFLALLRKRASQADAPESDHITSEFVQNLVESAGYSNKINPYEGLERPVPGDVNSGLLLGLRMVPSINKEHGRLHLDFDIVPQIPEGPLHEALFGIFGKDNFRANSTHTIVLLKEFLTGLCVRCAYPVPNKVSSEADQKSVAVEKGTLHQRRSFRIAKIKMPGFVADFDVAGTSYNVASWFEEHILQDEQKLQYPELPLVSDGRDHWIPLEMLVVEHAHALRPSPHLMPACKAHARHVLSRIDDFEIKETGKRFLKGLNVLDRTAENGTSRNLFDTVEPVIFVANTRDGVRAPAQQSVRKVADTTRDADQTAAAKDPVKIVIAELIGADDSSDTKLLERMRLGLTAQRNDKRSYEVPTTESKIVRTHHTRPVYKPIMEPDDSAMKPDMILGLVQDAIPQTKHMRTHLNGLLPAQAQPVTAVGPAREISDKKAKRYARQATNKAKKIQEETATPSGSAIQASLPKAPFIAVSRTHLRKRFDEFKNDETYFPFHLRTKMNFMLGGTNFKTNILDLKKDLTDIMIVGAHIRRPISGKETYCPSIATVVANTNEHALQYPGTYRLQRTFKSYTPDSEHDIKAVRGVLAPAIENLGSMMTDMFHNWDAEGRGRGPKSILFYRDGIDFDEKSCVLEVAAIKDAADEQYGEDAERKITYVVLNKNAQVTDVELPATSLSTPGGPKASLTRQWDFGTETDGIAKLRYYVIENGIDFTEEELRQLTSNLNKSSQLSAQTDQTARAMPLVWARKLASRIHDAFYSEFINLPEGKITLTEEQISTADANALNNTNEPYDKQVRALRAARNILGQDELGGDFVNNPPRRHDMWYI